MSMLRSVQNRLVSVWQEKTDAIISKPRKPALWRRAVADLIDRMLPLPFLAFFFPHWIAVVFLYHLLCDSSPERRSVGKWICRLRVVSAGDDEKCARWQSLIRRAGSAVSQSAWCQVWWLPEWFSLVLLYELISLACVMIDPAGRRLEDLFAGTQVVTERSYRRRQKQTAG